MAIIRKPTMLGRLFNTPYGDLIDDDKLISLIDVCTECLEAVKQVTMLLLDN